MIAKQIKGSNFRKALNYVHNKSGAKLIGGNMVGKDPESLTDEFRISSDLKRTVTQCVYHVSLSVSPSEKLSSEKWIDIGRTYLDGMEFKENQYAIYRHRDREHDHIHIIASRIRITDGSVVSDSWNYRRSERLVRQLEQQFGLSQTQCSWEKRKRSPKTGEIRRQRRTGEVNKRSQLQLEIAQSLKNTPSLEEFMSRLGAKGVSVRLRKSKEGKIEGISFGLDGVAFQGRQLGKDYSWTSLEPLFTAESECQRVRSKTVGYHLGQTRGHGDGETRGMISNHRVTASPRHRVNLNHQPTGFDHTHDQVMNRPPSVYPDIETEANEHYEQSQAFTHQISVVALVASNHYLSSKAGRERPALSAAARAIAFPTMPVLTQSQRKHFFAPTWLRQSLALLSRSETCHQPSCRRRLTG